MKNRTSIARKKQSQVDSKIKVIQDVAVTSHELLSLLDGDSNQSNYKIMGYKVFPNGFMQPTSENILQSIETIKQVLEGRNRESKFGFSIFHKPSQVQYRVFWFSIVQQYVIVRSKTQLNQ